MSTSRPQTKDTSEVPVRTLVIALWLLRIEQSEIQGRMVSRYQNTLQSVDMANIRLYRFRTQDVHRLRDHVPGPLALLLDLRAKLMPTVQTNIPAFKVKYSSVRRR